MVHVQDSLHNIVECMQSILGLPAFLQAMWDNHRNHFWEIVGVGQEAFWNDLDPEDPRLPGISDARNVENWQRIHFPFVLHGDSSLYAKKS